jgi:tetratricopeptide (TPR) repeat protein
LKRSHVVISMLISLMGIGYSTGAASALGLTVGEGRPDLAFEPRIDTEVLWLAQSSSNLTDAQQNQVDELLQQGQDRVEANDYAGAISAYEQAARIDRQNPKLFSGIGYLNIQSGNYSDAIEAYERAIELDPDNIPFHFGLAHSQFNNGQLDAAEQTYRDILDLNRRETDAYLGIGGIQMQRQDYGAALETYQNLVRIAPGYVQVYLALGTLYLQQEDYDQALSYLERGKAADPNNQYRILISYPRFKCCFRSG